MKPICGHVDISIIEWTGDNIDYVYFKLGIMDSKSFINIREYDTNDVGAGSDVINETSGHLWMDPIEKELVRRLFQEEYDGTLDKALKVLRDYGEWLFPEHLLQIKRDHPMLDGILKLYVTQKQPSAEKRQGFVGRELVDIFIKIYEDPIICTLAKKMIETSKTKYKREYYEFIAIHSSRKLHKTSECECLRWSYTIGGVYYNWDAKWLGITPRLLH